MAASRSIDTQTFLGYLRQSELLTPEEVAAIARRHGGQPRGRLAARALVAEGVLTRFQAERLLVGRTAGFVLGQYRILDQIGRGGMGRVYRAEHRTMKRVVALKVLGSDLLKTERAFDLFLHEIRAVAQLQHPNIVTAYDANEVRGRYFLVMEYVDGPNLEQLVRRLGPLSVGLACDYVRQVASGLQCAHQLGMVHRDIKPANLLVQRHGATGDASPGLVKISDFGLARLAAPATAYQGFHAEHRTILTKENTVMGTPDYLSPEQSRSLHRTDIRSDLYSLGCTLYFLLTGQVVFPGGRPIEKLLRHATDRPRPLGDFRGDVPAEVQGILNRMLAKVPDARFQTPAELADALQPYAVSGPTPWAPARPSTAEMEAYATPAPGPADDLAAHAATLDYELTPSPSATDGTSHRPGGMRNHLRLAVLVAVGLVGGLVLLAAILGHWR